MRRAALAALLALMLAGGAAATERRPFRQGSWAEITGAHAGRPLAVHFWSLTCAPCLIELPRWAEFRRANPGVAVVFVSTDPPEDAERGAAVLAKAGLADIPSWGFADPFAEKLRFEIDPRWRGELPRTVLIAADGSRRSVSGADLAAVEGWVAETVAVR
ncbi:MAG TPA: TlpA family protein disulfide reductase [Azospirillaceae bacterium]|nr:TlpA family protein disulfide reductase [Azospirillaceae bacterium]